MYKNFNITESEKEQILNRLRENGYGQPINEQNAPVKKPVVPQQTNNNYPLLKEIVNNLVNGVSVFVSKVLPGTIITMDNQSAFKVVSGDKNYGDPYKIGHRISFQYFKYGSGITNTNVKYGEVTDKDNTPQLDDIKSYASYIDKKVPFNLYFDNGQDSNNSQEISSIYVYMLCRDTTPDIAINVLKQLNPNVVKEISNDVFSMANGARRGNSDAPEVYNAEKYLKTLIQQQGQKPAAPIQGQPAQGQPQKPLNEGQEILKDVFKTLIK